MQKQGIFIRPIHIQIITKCSRNKAYKDYNYLLDEKRQKGTNKAKTRLTLQDYCDYYLLDIIEVSKLL